MASEKNIWEIKSKTLEEKMKTVKLISIKKIEAFLKLLILKKKLSAQGKTPIKCVVRRGQKGLKPHFKF